MSPARVRKTFRSSPPIPEASKFPRGTRKREKPSHQRSPRKLTTHSTGLILISRVIGEDRRESFTFELSGEHLLAAFGVRNGYVVFAGNKRAPLLQFSPY